AARRMRQLALGAPEPRFSVATPQELAARIEKTLVYALGQRRMPYYRLAGMAHILIFAGFSVLLLRTLVLWGRGFDPTFDLFGLLARGTLFGDAYSLAKDVFALLVIAGTAVFVHLRVVKKVQRMTLGIEGLVILGIIATMMVADILYDGAELALQARVLGTAPALHPWEPAGSAASVMLAGIESSETLRLLAHAGFWTHATLVLVFLNILPF